MTNKRKCPYCGTVVVPQYEYVYPERIDETRCPACGETVSMIFADPLPGDPDNVYQEDNWLDPDSNLDE